MVETAKDSKMFISLLDTIRVFNILNFCLILGIILSNVGLNRYIYLFAILLSSIVLSYVSQKPLIKRFGKENLLANSKIFRLIVFVINLLIVLYFFIVRDYIVVIMIIIFSIGYFIWAKWSTIKRKRKNKLISEVQMRM